MATWDLENVVAAANNAALAGRPRAVLLSTGALNPPHRGHVKMIEQAKVALETEHGFAVIGAFLSPSHDMYVHPKCRRFKKPFAPGVDRCAMTSLVIQDTGLESWLSVGRWESDLSHSYWPDYPVVLDALASAADARLRAAGIDGAGAGPDDGIVVFYVCGTDHAQKCGLSHGFGNPRRGVVIVPRAGDPPAAGSDRATLVFSVAMDTDCADLSSSKFHAAVGAANRAEAERIVGPSVFQYLASNSLLGCSPATVPPPIAPRIAPRKRLAFISASTLSRVWRTVDPAALDDSLFVFGSKRCWLFPATPAEHKDSAAQPTNYAGFDPELLALVLAKEKRNEVFFLKPDDYAFEGYGSDAAGEPGSWRRASDWLQTVLDPAATTTTTGGGGTYRPLLLDPAAWRAMSPGQLVHCFSITGVIDNLKSGGHDYDETLELLHQSNPTLVPCMYPPAFAKKKEGK